MITCLTPANEIETNIVNLFLHQFNKWMTSEQLIYKLIARHQFYESDAEIVKNVLNIIKLLIVKKPSALTTNAVKMLFLFHRFMSNQNNANSLHTYLSRVIATFFFYEFIKFSYFSLVETKSC